jgi:L-ascorbate metabolism protein UlaG (beta-lactamase superfamily)
MGNGVEEEENMIKPIQQDDEFLDDVERARSEPGQLHLWWLGQSGFLIQWQGHHLLFDPYLSDSLTQKYAGTDKPHVRMTERVVAPERLDFIHVVTSSHNHTDHLDRETLVPLLQANPKVQLVIPEANREFVADRLQITSELPCGLDAGQSISLAGFKIHAVPAAHNEVEKDGWGRHRFLGYVVEAGPWTIYHSGDTLRYEGMEDWLVRQPIDIALLPINGNRPERRVAGNLDGPEAATLARDIGARLVIPCHYDMFEFNTVSPEAFAKAAAALGQPCRILRCGERWSTSGWADTTPSLGRETKSGRTP